MILFSSHHEVESRSAGSIIDTLDSFAQVAAFLSNSWDAGRGTGADEDDDITTTTTRESRKDKHLHSTNACLLPLRLQSLSRFFTGVLPHPVLPPFPYNMSVAGKPGIPATPRVISPSPTPSEREAAGSSQDSYFGPVTRSAARKRVSTPQPVEEDLDEDEIDSDPPELRRARTRSRSPMNTRKMTRLTPSKPTRKTQKTAADDAVNGKTNGHLLSPPTTAPPGFWGWRDFSRSPSPLGLIPIHRHWRTIVHKHEVPRKALHVSIGFVVLGLYLTGQQTTRVAPWLLAMLVPITATDALRHRSEPFNRFYVRVWGALMRESEFAGYNGVIFYLLGAWIATYFFPKDVAVVAVLLLSWCDTAASTVGRLLGRYTPRIRRGKSVAGSVAACLVGIATAAWFWGWLAPTQGPFPGDEDFMFTGVLRLPTVVANALSLTPSQATISGGLALGVLSIWSGFVAAASEVSTLR